MNMPFGKYKHTPIWQIDDRRYLVWCIENCDLDYWLKYAIQQQIDRLPPAAPSRQQQPEASAIERLIRQWYHALSLKYHPDRGGSHLAMVAVNDAYELIRSMAKDAGVLS